MTAGSPNQQANLLDALPANIALLDANGVILAVNESWRRFAAANALAGGDFGVGDNYLDICDQTQGTGAADAVAAAQGIRDVLSGKITAFDLEYPCHSPTEQRWFHMMVTAWAGDGPGRVVVMHVDITDRHLAQRHLAQALRRNDLLLQTIDEGIHEIDAAGRIVFQNASALRMLGYEKDELLGQDFHAVIHHHKADGSIYPVEESPIYATLQDGQSRRIRGEVFFRKNGSALPVSYTCAAIRGGPKDQITGAVVSFRDISERKRDEQLRNAESDVLEMISAGVPLPDIFQKIVQTIDSLIPNVFSSILLPEQDGKILRHAASYNLPDTFLQAVDGVPVGPAGGCSGTAAHRKSMVVVSDIANDPLCLPFRKVAKDHGIRSCWAVPVLDGKGNVLATFAVYASVRRTPGRRETELVMKVGKLVSIAFDRQKDMAELKAKEERFRIITQATADVVWDWNLLTNQVWWNEGIRTLFGYDYGATTEGIETWINHIHPDDRQWVIDSIHAAIAGSDPDWAEEYRFLRADGTAAQVLDRGSIIRDELGKAVRMVGSMVDMTRQRQLEEQLRQAQRLDSLGQLTGGVAHDFNNLLTVILGNAEMILESLHPEHRLWKLAALTKTAAERGAELTNRLLAFSRRQALEPKAVDVNRLLVSLDELLRRTLGEHIEIRLVLQSGAWEAMADTPQLESALLNLCLNARDAMPSGGRLTLETANVDVTSDEVASSMEVMPGQYVLLAVSDTGVGMTPEVLEQAFDPFFTTKEVGKGSGLGLSMVYGFAKQSKGHVKIYSEVGRGTTVKLYLPRAADGAHAMVRGEVDNVSGGAEKILMVEDDALVREHVSALLISLGYQVVSVRNAAEALQVLESRQDFDLLFTDVVMPGGMSGRQLAEEVKRRLPSLPVLFTSGYTENAMIQHGRLDPGVQLLQKPYRRRELADKIRQALARV